LLTAGAKSRQDDLVGLVAKAMDLHDLGQTLLQRPIAELDYLTAPAADQVLVMRATQILLVAHAVSDEKLSNQTRFCQEFERAVDGGRSDLVLSEFDPKIGHIEMAGHLKDFLGDALAGSSDMKLAAPEVFSE